MKKLLLLILSLLLVLSVACSSNDAKEEGKDNKEEEVVLNSGDIASVNGKSIPKDEYDKMIALVKYSYEQMYGDDYFTKKGNENLLSELEKQLVDEMVNAELMRQYADKNSIKVDPKVLEVDFEKAKEKIQGEPKLKKTLEDNKIDDDLIKKNIEEQLLSKLIIDKLIEKLNADEQKLKKIEEEYVLRVKASHILVKDEKEAKEIFETLKKEPAKFAEIAKKKSVDPGSAKNGGDLGFFSRGRMIPEFEMAAFTGKINEVQAPVKTNYGYHIIKTTKKETINSMKNSGAKSSEIEGARNRVIYDESIRELNSELEKLKKESNIKINKE